MINNFQEALKILELDSNPSKEEIKKNYKKLARKYHPDVNKEPQAENKYKEVCAAYEFLKTHQEIPFSFASFQIEDFLKNFGLNSEVVIHNKRREPLTHILELSFKESILGVVKSITFSYADKCETCNSKGFILQDKCSKCDGKGFHQYINNRIHHHISCIACKGSGKEIQSCQECFAEKNMKTVTREIRIPGGVKNGTQMRIKGHGHYINNYREDAFIIFVVLEHPTMQLVGNQVYSELKLSLLEALQGINKEVETVLGKTILKIPSRSRHLDQVILPSYGINKEGNHIFTLKVDYPENTDALIEYLQKL